MTRDSERICNQEKITYHYYTKYNSTVAYFLAANQQEGKNKHTQNYIEMRNFPWLIWKTLISILEKILTFILRLIRSEKKYLTLILRSCVLKHYLYQEAG